MHCREALNDTCEAQLGAMTHVYNVTTCDWTNGPGYVRHLYCESPGLSLPGECNPYRALLVDAISVADLTPDLHQCWIDLCALCLGLGNYNPQRPARTKAINSMAKRRTKVIVNHVGKGPTWRPNAAPTLE